MNKGFTLVELLAVIVILAVLALIATPVVLSIIDDTKESAMLRSAEMYLSGVENAVMRENMNSGGNFRPNECEIADGTLSCNSTTVEVEVNGEVPETGSIVFENGKIKEVTLNYESGTIIKDPNGYLVYEDSSEPTLASLCTIADGYTANTIGAKYSCDFGSGARNFYILELGTNKVSNSTLEENEVALILEGNYDVSTQPWCDQNGPNPNNTICAADGLTSKLDEIASVWSKLERDQIVLPTGEQICVADGKREYDYTGWVYLSKTNTWLYNWPDNESYGSVAPYSYWTSSPDGSTIVWYLDSDGHFADANVSTSNRSGVRPVVNLKL